MRIADTLESWQEQLDKIKSNQHLMNFIKAISKEEAIVVAVKNTPEINNLDEAMCHKNVKECVEQFGGKQIFGWILRPWELYETEEFDGMFLASFHSNWKPPEGELISITPENNKFQIFLPDTIRRFNFDTQESYNNRVVYLDNYKPPSYAFNPSRYVNYFFGGGCADRDRLYEKYRIPKSPDEVTKALPDSMKCVRNGRVVFTPEGEKWAKLKFSLKTR